jgi:YD repeat-containing protein
MSLYVAKGSPTWKSPSTELQSLLFEALAELGERRHALAVPPDLARRDSRTGELTRYAYDYYGSRLEAISPGAQVV